MRIPIRSSQFKRDVKRAGKRSKDIGKLRSLLTLLIKERPLPQGCLDHVLKGDWKGFRDAHIESDWLLIYRVAGNELHLARTGTHADIFDE